MWEAYLRTVSWVAYLEEESSDPEVLVASGYFEVAYIDLAIQVAALVEFADQVEVAFQVLEAY